jgi:hypothetical protein
MMAIGMDATDDYASLPRSAQRLLALCAERADKDGLARITSNGACTRLQLSGMSVKAGMAALREKGFAARAGQGLVVLNMTKVQVTTRYVEGDAVLLANFHRHAEGWAYSHARKSAAGKAAQARNPRLWGRPKGVQDGVVEEADGQGGTKPPH